MTAYNMIREHYGYRTANRSGRLLIHHIDEGLAILSHLKASHVTKEAFTIHPLLQEDEDLKTFFYTEQFKQIDIDVVLLAMEYRNKANAWLRNNFNTTYGRVNKPTLPLLEVQQMLIADKVQNYKDLKTYNKDHPAYKELCIYFEEWLLYLGVTLNHFNIYCNIMETR